MVGKSGRHQIGMDARTSDSRCSVVVPALGGTASRSPDAGGGWKAVTQATGKAPIHARDCPLGTRCGWRPC